jgi:hypothetical protein
MNREKENEFGLGGTSGRLSSQGLPSSNGWNTTLNPAGIYS